MKIYESVDKCEVLNLKAISYLIVLLVAVVRI